MCGVLALDVTHHDHTAVQIAVANDARLTVVLPAVFKFETLSGQYETRILEIETTLGQGG